MNLVGMLLDAGADANRANQDGETPVMLAARTGVVKIAELLVGHGANVNAPELFRKQTALMWASAESHPEMVAFLISKGAAVNVRATANDWAKSDDLGAPRSISSDRRPHTSPVCGPRRMPWLCRSLAQGWRGHRSAESGWDDAADDGHRQFSLTKSPDTCWTRAPTRIRGTGGDVRRFTWS